MRAGWGLAFLVGFVANAAEIRVFVNVPDDTRDAVYLSDALCGWRADCRRLERVAPLTYAARVDLPAEATELEFKVTRGDWRREAADAAARPLPNFVFRRFEREKGADGQEVTVERREMTVSVANWTDGAPFGVTGKLARHALRDAGYARDVLVWTPAAQPGPYRVLYMHDAQNLFDPRASNTGVDWGVDEALTELMREGAIEPTMVVGVECGDRRMEEYDLTTTEGQAYEHFLIRTTRDFVARKYSARTEREASFLMGSSMGAVVSFEMAWRHPEAFSRAAGLSLAVHAKSQSLYRAIGDAPKPALPLRFYMDHGDRNGDEGYAKYARPFAQIFRELLPAGSSLSYREFPFAGHTETDWRRRLKETLRCFLGPGLCPAT